MVRLTACRLLRFELLDCWADGQLSQQHAWALLPLSQLAARTEEVQRDRPVVTICRSGARSAQATVLLQKAGYTQVANLAGGMLRWRAEALPVEAGAE